MTSDYGPPGYSKGPQVNISPMGRAQHETRRQSVGEGAQRKDIELDGAPVRKEREKLI